MSVAYNPFDPDILEDPYPAYAELRATKAAHYLEDHGLWVIPRYEDVAAVLRDPATFSSADGWGRVFSAVLGHDYVFGEGEGRNLIATDPPLHTSLRRTVDRAFTFKRIQELRSQIEGIANDLVEGMLEKGQDGPIDIVDEYFSAMPVTVIATMLGVEPGMRADSSTVPRPEMWKSVESLYPRGRSSRRYSAPPTGISRSGDPMPTNSVSIVTRHVISRSDGVRTCAWAPISLGSR